MTSRVGRSPEPTPGRIGSRAWAWAWGLTRRFSLVAGIALAGGAALSAVAPPDLHAQSTHVLTVVGLGGDPAYSEAFLEAGLQIRAAALERFGLPDDAVILLAEDAAIPEVDGRSDREGVEAAVQRMAGSAGPSDRILVVLIGHGSWRGGEARFNLPGRDMTAPEWDALLGGLGSRPVAVVNAASASGPFVEALSGENRTVVAATKTGGERNETQFARFFAAALASEASDLDRDGRVSLLELFTWTRAEVARWYEEESLLLTEHAVLDDNGDGEGMEAPSVDGPDGILAATFRLAPATRADRGADGPAGVPSDAAGDSVLVRLRGELEALESRVARLRQRRSEMTEAAYEAALESLLVEIALKNREIAGREGGGP